MLTLQSNSAAVAVVHADCFAKCHRSACSFLLLAALRLRSCIMAMETLFFLASLAQLGAGLPTNNTTSLPPGASNHGDPNFICTTTFWIDIATFFIGNFVAHASTTRSLPSELGMIEIANRAICLFVPGYGLVRGIKLIISLVVLGKTKLEVAARAGALSMVVRSLDWEPVDGDRIENFVISADGVHNGDRVKRGRLYHCAKNLMLIITSVDSIQPETKEQQVKPEGSVSVNTAAPPDITTNGEV